MSPQSNDEKCLDLRFAAAKARQEAAAAGTEATRNVMGKMAVYYDEQADALEPAAPTEALAKGLTVNEQMKKHIVEERVILLDQANMFATDDAHRIETRDGEMEDVSEERLEIMLGQIRDIDRILSDPKCRSET